jgi:hypothetical protein
MFGAPSAGDRDNDKDADAVDGWLSEPYAHRHPGDRNPPRGVPVAWSGGRNGYGHRAVSLGNGMVRSTDAPTRGRVGTVHISWFEKNWGLKYLGWSSTITGEVIPMPPPPEPPSRGARVDDSLQKLRRAERKAADGSRRETLLGRAINVLKKIKPTR